MTTLMTVLAVVVWAGVLARSVVLLRRGPAAHARLLTTALARTRA